ncbi:transposase, partial [Schinkia azotoformans MEV2011]
GIKRATKLVETAKKSIGIKIGIEFAKHEIDFLIRQYELYKEQLEQLDNQIETLLTTIPGTKQMIDINGLGVATVAQLFAEVGDISKYSHPQQLVNLAGLSLREHSSGKFKGQTRITKRGRSGLRRALYLAIRPLVAHNETFKALHHYYTKRSERPLKSNSHSLPCVVSYYVFYLSSVKNSVDLMVQSCCKVYLKSIHYKLLKTDFI